MKKYPITRFVRWIKKKHNNRKKKSKKKIRSLYFKTLIFVVELHGITCVTLSYIMGWNDKLNVCENLSITIVGEIIAPIITYAISKTVENVFEKNKLSFSTPLQAVDSIADDPQEERIL